MGAVNAGATPGKILTGLAAFWFQSSWKHAWLAMAAVSFGGTVWNACLLPKRAVTHDGMKAKQHLHFRLFTRAACISVSGTRIVYGLLFSVYLTFAVDLLSSVGAMKSPVDLKPDRAFSSRMQPWLILNDGLTRYEFDC